MAEPKSGPYVGRDEFAALESRMSEGMSAILERLEAMKVAEEGRARASRTQEMAAYNPVHEDYEPWDEMTLLNNPAFKPREGMVQCWIRTAIAGEPDGANLARMFNQGWSPRGVDTLPPAVRGTCTINFEGTQTIGWRGTILCEMDEAQHRRFVVARDAMASNMMRGVVENMMNDHERGQRGFGAPQFTERTRKVETGQRPAPVDVD